MLITRGAGLTRTQGKRIEVGDVAGFAKALGEVPPEVEGWWSPHIWRNDKRIAEDWECSGYIALDLDTAGHAQLEDVHGQALEEAAQEGRFYGNVFHRTPAGARVIVALEAPCSNADEYEKAARGAAFAVQSDLIEIDLFKGLSIDPKVHTDRARLYFTPTSIAKGIQRNARVITIRPGAYRVLDLLQFDQGGVVRGYVDHHERRGGPVERARAYVQKMGGSIEGAHGDDHAFKVAAVLVNDFDLGADDVWDILREWNFSCEPPWNEKDLRRFMASAARNAKKPARSKLDEIRPDRGPWPKPVPALPAAERSNNSDAAVVENTDPFAGAFKYFTAEELLEAPPRQEFILHPYIPARTVTTLAGPGGASKTTLLTHLACARAIGADFFGKKLRRGKTVILTTEDGAVDYRRKIFALSHEIEGFDAKVVAASIAIIDCSGMPVRLVEADRGNWYPTGIPDILANAIKAQAEGADLVILETVSRLAGGVETNESLSILVESAQRLCRLAGVAVILVAHVGQEAGRQGYTDAYAARGGSALGDNGRSTMILTHLNENNVKKFAPDALLSPEQMRNLCVLTHAKSNGAKPADPMLLERCSTEYGAAVLREYEVRQADPEAPLRLLVGVIKEFSRGGVQVTRRFLEDRCSRIGITRASIAPLLAECVDRGWLSDVATKKGEGTHGGKPTRAFIPTGADEQ